MRAHIRKSARNGNGLTSDWLKIKHTFSGAATDVKKNAGSLLSHSVDKIKTQSSKAQANILRYAMRKPFKALGIALLTGAVIGFLVKRK